MYSRDGQITCRIDDAEHLSMLPTYEAASSLQDCVQSLGEHACISILFSCFTYFITKPNCSDIFVLQVIMGCNSALNYVQDGI